LRERRFETDAKMSDDDIDLNRVVSDPAYRRAVIEWLNLETGRAGDETGQQPAQAESRYASEDR